MRPAPTPVRLVAALAVLATVGLLGIFLPLLFSSLPFPAGLLAGGALGGLAAGLLLSGRRWAVRLCLAGTAVLGGWMAIQMVVETVRFGADRVGDDVLFLLVPLVAAGTVAWMHAARDEAPLPARPSWPAFLAGGAATLLLGLLALPWVSGEAVAEGFGTRSHPMDDYLGFRLTVGALAGGLSLAAAGALLAAPRGRLPVAFAAIALGGAAVSALVPFLGVQVCTFEFLGSYCLPDPEPRAPAAVAAAVSLVASAFLLLSLRADAPPRKA